MPDHESRLESEVHDLLAEAAIHWFGPIDARAPIGSAPHLLRVTAGGADYVMRAWGPRIPVEAANLAAQALDRARPSAGGRLPVPVPLPGAPDAWTVRAGDRLVSATTWLPGRPLARYGDFRTPDGEVIDVPLPATAPAHELVLEAVRTIGIFHAATASLAAAAGSAPSIASILRSSESAWTAQRRDVGQRAAGSPEIRRWLRCGNRVFPVAHELIEGRAAADGSASIIHGDLWPANILIEGNEPERTLTGVVGWSRPRVGSPLVDLAHLAIHTTGWSGALAESVLGAYTEVAPLAPSERRLLPVVAALDLVPRVGGLLDLAFVDDRMIGHEAQPVLRSGLKSLLTSLENLTQILAPDAEWNQRKVGEQRERTGGAKRSGETGTTPARRPGAGRLRPGSRPGTQKRG